MTPTTPAQAMTDADRPSDRAIAAVFLEALSFSKDDGADSIFLPVLSAILDFAKVKDRMYQIEQEMRDLAMRQPGAGEG
jgi:hypothetical protein